MTPVDETIIHQKQRMFTNHETQMKLGSMKLGIPLKLGGCKMTIKGLVNGMVYGTGEKPQSL